MRAGDFINGRIDSNVWSHRFCDAANQHVLYSINCVGEWVFADAYRAACCGGARRWGSANCWWTTCLVR